MSEENSILRGNPNAFTGSFADVYFSLDPPTGVCGKCGRALWGGPGGWHDAKGWENCPIEAFHEPGVIYARAGGVL